MEACWKEKCFDGLCPAYGSVSGIFDHFDNGPDDEGKSDDKEDDCGHDSKEEGECRESRIGKRGRALFEAGGLIGSWVGHKNNTATNN